ncbi:MAG: efflux RND transporter permease subunit [bacterium]|nr:efflux RND transporter permease subunit [bacterium]
MRLVDAALANRSTVFFLMAALILLGSFSYSTLPRELFPDIDIPLIVVYVQYPGAAPTEIESQIIQPLERELTGLAGLDKLTSESRESLAVVTAEFVTGTDIDVARQKVRDRVDQAEVDFPDDAEEPGLQEISFAEFPLLQINLHGDVGPVILKRLAEDLQDEVETVPGVLRATIVGGLEREVKVDVDPERLRLYGLSLDDVVDAVADENVSIPSGDIDLGEMTYAVRVPGEVDDPLAVADFVIKAPGGRPVFVRDVAEVTFGFEERSSHARINARESVAVSVQKRVGANIIAVADQVKEIVAEFEPTWPVGVEAEILADQSKETKGQVRDLENSVLSGLVLVILVLMFALGLRNAVFVGLAIPFSMLLTFIVIQLSGVTLNMIVLFALVLAVGMLVDNAVVVIENIYRHMQEGASRRAAASAATREVGAAITVSTFTTLGAFAPLFTWPGVIGDFMKYLPWTVSFALLASLVVAFTINPVICSMFMSAGRPRDDDSRQRRASIIVLRDRLGERFVGGYRGLLEWALDHRLIVVGATLAVFVGVLFAFAANPTGIELLAEMEPNQIFVDVDLPTGTRLEKTDAVALTLESRLTDLGDLRVLAGGVGEGSRSDGFSSGGDPHLARLTLDLVDRKQRRRNSFETLDEVRRVTAGVPGAAVVVGKPDDGPPVGAPLEIQITGEDFETLGEIASRVRAAIDGIPGLVSLDDDYDLARPEVVVTVDRVEAARLGLTTADVASTLRTAISGTDASTYRRGDEDIDITVRLAESARSSISDLERLVVVNESGEQIPLAAIASLERASSITAIRHEERRRRVTVTGDVAEPKLADPVRREAQRRLEAVPGLLPAGYGLAFGGQNEEEEENKEFLSRAFLYALVIVLALMVGKFNSLAIPSIILTSVAMSMIGVLLGLLTTGLPFSIIMTGVGVISLAGIVVNNAIVLLDYGEKLRKKGLPRREVVVRTGLRRLRPVLLTAATTILGLMPLTTGVELDFRSLAFSTGSESSQYWRSMGVAVIFGLAFATFLTLVLVPVLYDFLLGWHERRGAKKAGADPAPEPRAPELAA